MTSEQASALSNGEHLLYWDGRIATVTGNNATDQEVAITFDGGQTTSFVKYYDFLRAEVTTTQASDEELAEKNRSISTMSFKID